MSDGEQGKGPNKVVLILAGLILVAVVVMFALRYGGGPAGELAGTYTAEAEKEITVSEVEIPEIKTPEVQEVKKPVLPKAFRQLTPEETVESFMTAVLEERYDDAMEYISSQNRYFKSKWDLVEYHGILYQETAGADDLMVTVSEREYLDKAQTMAEVDFQIYANEKIISSSAIKLQKENDVWKVL